MSARRAVGMMRDSQGPEHPDLVAHVATLSDALVEAGAFDEAVREARQQLELAPEEDVRPEAMARLEFALAKAQWRTTDRAAALEAARSALRRMEGRPAGSQLAADVGRWLQERGVSG